MIPLPDVFLGAPFAHRALHDISDGRPENSRAAIRAAIAHGYAIEIDLQLSADGQAMVFHDFVLGRLTGQNGKLCERSAAELEQIPLLGGDGEGIPTLDEVLDLVAGRVPVLIEIKDQDGAMGPDVGVLQQATAAALEGYRGPTAVMSFNPLAVADFARHAPHIPRGLTTCSFSATNWPMLPEKTRARLRQIPDYQRLGAGFISHDARDLSNPHVERIRALGAAVLCWTVYSAQQEASARDVAANVTFEGYLPALPPA